MMGLYGGGMGGGLWILMGLFWIVLIGAIVWLVIRLLPANGRAERVPPASSPALPPAPPRTLASAESPLDILDRRFARGEIDLETYQQHRAALLEARGTEA